MSESAAVIALLQFNATQSSRMFFDHESLAAALDHICALYEKELKLLNPKIANITYDIADLYSYLDALHSISLLTCVPLRAPVVNAFMLTHCFSFSLYVRTATMTRSVVTCRGTRNGSKGTC